VRTEPGLSRLRPSEEQSVLEDGVSDLTLAELRSMSIRADLACHILAKFKSSLPVILHRLCPASATFWIAATVELAVSMSVAERDLRGSERDGVDSPVFHRVSSSVTLPGLFDER
jgi:hypothetical protein